MIYSMTGYGSAQGMAEGFKISIELKSVNNRYLETSVRLPRNFMFAEDMIKKTVQNHISRGKVDVYVSVDATETDDITVKVNESLARNYAEAVKTIAGITGLENDMTAVSISRMPDVLNVEKKDMDTEAVAEGICSVLENALVDFDVMRRNEGIKLRDDVLQRLSTIEDYVGTIEAAAPETVEMYRKRLIDKMNEVIGNYDESRIIQEAAIFADHIATDEETVRLRSHMSQLDTMINSSSPIGRKIDFLVQEFNREANTIGSKCQNSDIAHVVVDLKSEIEKIREQIQNIE